MYMDNGNTLVPQHLTQVSISILEEGFMDMKHILFYSSIRNGSKKKMIFENFAFLMLPYHKGL